MTIEELKGAWQQYNQKLVFSQRLNDRLILSMLKERSRSRVSAIRRENWLYMVWMIVVLVFLGGVFAGNPFDFTQTWQYIPYGVLAVGVILAIISLVNSLRNFTVDINKADLGTFLKRTIEEYEKNKKIQASFGIIMLLAGISTVFSFLPKKLEHKELWPALGETALMIGIIFLIYFLAFKFGAFKNRKKEGFENDLKELNELKALSSELGESAAS
ncbi:hypothetical protein [Terrimonas alba]|uniref:hypothetical protein n=1 Tax=Terrimonas alba TaxID=3349636 RepID=UPI0035F30D08